MEENKNEIRWSSAMIDDLINVVAYFRKNKIGETLEILGDYFIKRHLKKLSFENYTMDFIDSIDAHKINDGEYKLAFICELVNSHANKKIKLTSISKKNKEKKIYRDRNNFRNVYNCVSFMIKYSVSRNLKFENKPDNRIFYLTSIIREKISPDRQNIVKDEVDVLVLSYYLTSELINIYENRPEIAYQNSVLLSNSENLDISICSNCQIREMMEILQTKRTLFVRFLLVLAFEISKIRGILSPIWIEKAIKIRNHEEMLFVFNSSLIETLLFLTSERIKTDEEIQDLQQYFENEVIL
jgi:hypothetical protein